MGTKEVDLKFGNFYVESATDPLESAFQLSDPHSYAYYQQDRGTFFIKKKRPGDEINTKMLPPAQRKLFDGDKGSKRKEWNGVQTDNKAVKVFRGEEARRLRAHYQPLGRCLPSRWLEKW